MQISIDNRATLEHDLQCAIAAKQFRLHYQAQENNERGIVGAEVLLRWQHPQRGLVLPGDFIYLAEETGLILPIGQWVIESACQQIKLWEASPMTNHLQLAVNVSAKQFREPDFVEQVRGIVKRAGIVPNRLKLELTESLLLDNVEEIIERMYQFREMGICFSMDDFGTGFSSLSYLTRLPLSQLKIDQSFVRNIGIRPSDAIIVQTIIGMTQNLGMDVIAEGVETTAQRDFLNRHHCGSFQGFLLSKPIPLNEFEALIAQRSSTNAVYKG